MHNHFNHIYGFWINLAFILIMIGLTIWVLSDDGKEKEPSEKFKRKHNIVEEEVEEN